MDASTRAYSAVVYLRIFHALDSFQISFLAVKTKVAPFKTISIPRLELNAVILLCRLLKWTLTSLNLHQIPLYGWTDSTITLAWIKQHPSKWVTYVANRVSEVQTYPQFSGTTFHRSTIPLITLLTAIELVSHNLWWSGPLWLKKSSASWLIHDPTSKLDELQTA